MAQIILDIHKADAFSRNKKYFVGEEVRAIDTHTSVIDLKGYAGEYRFTDPDMRMNHSNATLTEHPDGCQYFLCIYLGA